MPSREAKESSDRRCDGVLPINHALGLDLLSESHFLNPGRVICQKQNKTMWFPKFRVLD